MPIRVKINRKVCIACSSCVQIAPEVFKIEGWAATIKEKWRVHDNPPEGIVPDDLLELIEKAAHNCPSSALMFIKE